jgi:hypothetical protein
VTEIGKVVEDGVAEAVGEVRTPARDEDASAEKLFEFDGTVEMGEGVVTAWQVAGEVGEGGGQAEEEGDEGRPEVGKRLEIGDWRFQEGYSTNLYRVKMGWQLGVQVQATIL